MALGLKLAAWWVTGSVALYSDALETIINVVAAFTAIAALRISARPADADHPYGHQKAEYFSAVLEGMMVLGAAVAILHEVYAAFAHLAARRVPRRPAARPASAGSCNPPGGHDRGRASSRHATRNATAPPLVSSASVREGAER